LPPQRIVPHPPSPAAKINAGETVGRVVETAHQMHGATGVAHELSLHRLTRRLWPWCDELCGETLWS
jgi:acyl-CoA dehydrogenase